MPQCHNSLSKFSRESHPPYKNPLNLSSSPEASRPRSLSGILSRTSTLASNASESPVAHFQRANLRQTRNTKDSSSPPPPEAASLVAVDTQPILFPPPRAASVRPACALGVRARQVAALSPSPAKTAKFGGPQCFVFAGACPFHPSSRKNWETGRC